MTAKMTLRLDDDLSDKVGFVAHLLGISKNQLIVIAVSQYVKTTLQSPDFQSRKETWLQRMTSE